MPITKTLRRPSDIVAAGLAPAARLADLEQVASRYAVAITHDMACLIDPQDPVDPVARQFVPDLAELDPSAEESVDPIGDLTHSPVAGVVHRYHDRVLLKLNHNCAVYCRFCFRREMVGPEGHGTLGSTELDDAIGYIADHPEIWEVIVTGGDPLVLSPRRLGEVMARLSTVQHVRIVRFHTRVPVVDPESISPELIAALTSGGQTVYVAVHTNHARELTRSAREACARLSMAGIPLLGQTVLLKGVNDSPTALEDLFRAMVETRIKPYYLHHADLAPGTGHFRTSLQTGQALMSKLRGRVSGLCQPTYVLDIPDGHGKVPVGPNYLSDDLTEVTDPTGIRHAYVASVT